MASHRMTNEELDEQFEQFLKESFSDESGDVGGSAKRTSVLDSLGKTSSQRPAKKAAISSRPWWQDEDYDDNAGGTGRAVSPEPPYKPIPKPRNTKAVMQKPKQEAPQRESWRSDGDSRSGSQGSVTQTRSSHSPPGDASPNKLSSCDETLPDRESESQCSDEDGSSRRSFQKSSRKSQPIREEEEEEFLGQMAFSDEERQQGVPSRVRQEPEDSMLASGPDLTPGGPGLETLEEEEEKARFFARLEAGASSTLDYSRLNRDLDSPRSTPAQSLRKPEEAGEGSEEDEKPATEGISQACADSPDYSDNFEEDEKEKEPAETMPPISSLDAKGSLYDSLDSNDRRAPSMQLRGKDPAFSSDKGQSYGQSCGSEMEALQEAYRQISDAPGVPEDRVDGRRSRPSTSASPLEQSRGDLLPASTNGSELPTAEELMRPIRPETSDYIRGFPLKPSSRSGTGLDLRPGSAEPRHAGVKSGPVAEPWRERGSSGSLSPDTPLRRQPLSIREEVERLMEDQDREHHQSPIPSTQASRAKQKPRGGPAGRPSLSSTRKSTVTSALRGSKAKEDGHSAMACRFSRPNRPTVKGKASPPPTQRKPVARVQHSPPPIKGIPENAGLQVSGDLVASVQSFAAFLQQQVGPAGPQVATATWDVNARRDVATGVKGLSDSNVEEGSMVQGLAHKEIDHLSHKQIDHPSQKERDLAQRERDLAQRERDLAQKERDLHLRLEEVEMQHREDLGAVKQENYVLQSKLRKAESSQGGQRWGEAADPMTMDRLQLLEKEVQQQETIIQGYHKENEKLCWEMKAQQTRSRATEEAMFAENQRLLNELRLAKEQLKNMPGTPLNACPMEHTQRITELLTHMEVIQKGEAKWSEESRSLRQQKQALEVDLQLMKKERDLLKAQVLSSSGDPGAVLGVRGDGHREEVAALQKKLHWYAENQQLLDRDAARLRAASDETRQLKEQLENLKIEVRKSSSQQHTKAKEKTGDAKKIQALERQVKVMEDLLRRRQPNSLPALIYAAASASGPGGEDPTTTATPTLVTGLLERKVERLEAELDGHKEEAKRGLRAMEQQFQRIKLSYEQQISELEQKLVQRQNPEGAAPPPCPPSGGGEQQGVTEAQRSVELALQEQIQSLQQQLSRKAPPPEPERAPPPEPERARRSPSRHQVQSEAAFGARIERLTQELAAKTRSVQELSRTVERLQRERKGLLSGSWSREARPANANAAARPRAAASGDARVGGAGVGGGGDEAGAGEEEERFPAAQYEKTYRPDAFAGSHITEVLEENQALREQLGRLEERPDAGEPHGALAHAREELCRLKESTAEQLSSLVAHQRLEMDQLRAGHAQDHSSSRVAQLSNRLNTQEIVVQHLKEQLKDFKATKDTLAVSKIREETLQTQLTRLLEELRQAREAHSPELRHLHGLEAKICSMELRHTQREDQLKQLICQTRQVVESEQHSEVERWKGLAQGRSREVEAFRLELDSILDVLRELRRQGVVFPSPESHLHTPFTWKS
ncbi:centrosomal protein of 162 kDa isoform X1 [Gadus chalcogrammus]|uniref:centrosomal protein of 162 kDa isoform X1 n=2 Tax=Gadus chalcogrammus TaxID=1042646 RepID=UPI0024C49B1B|nr:centrosomal protein of 162 kDa isoform X1 [Gadus chalcogrammus]XP_056458751.1 centrosomal protein of 162 kDa isoform X1 [Gadus chalcogrammus]